jgi:DNA invertase Pin-like site-specific DNA recombinase
MTNYAIIYSRFSPRPNAEECKSVARQIDNCKKWCDFKEIKILRIHEDKAFSGARADNRPALQEALAEACDTGSALVVYSLERLARNTRDALEIIDKLGKARVELHIVNLNIDTGTHVGRFFFTVISAFAEFERRVTSQRTSEAMQKYQQEGRRMSDRAPYGFMRDPQDPNMLIEDPQEQDNIDRMVELRYEDLSLREIVKQLEEDGRKPRPKVIKKEDGRKEAVEGTWNHQLVKRVLKRKGIL